MQTKLLINGQLIAGEGAAQAVLNPSLGTTLVEINEASSSQVDAAVQAADAAFDSWSQTVPKDRAQLLLRLADAIDANAESLARLESNNCGKPYSAALNDELPAVADVFRFFAGASRCMSGSADRRRPAWCSGSCACRARGRGPGLAPVARCGCIGGACCMSPCGLRLQGLRSNWTWGGPVSIPCRLGRASGLLSPSSTVAWPPRAWHRC